MLFLNVNFHSFTDKRCSGKQECGVKVYELVDHSKPCPLELSSYMEASFVCVSGNSWVLKTLWICKAASIRTYYRNGPGQQVGYALKLNKKQQFNIMKHFFFFNSYADRKCSGSASCEINIFELLPKFRPCPVELSSYLQASFSCVPGKDYMLWSRSVYNCLISHFCLQKLCRQRMLREGCLYFSCQRSHANFHTMPHGTFLLSWNFIPMLSW